MKRLAFVVLIAVLCGLVIVPLQIAPLAAQDTTNPIAPTPEPLPTRLPRPAPSSSVTAGNATLQLFFQTLPQGDTGLMRVTPLNGKTIANARARFLNVLSDFWQDTDGYYGLLSTDMEQQTGKNNELDVFVTYSDGTRDTISTKVEITLGGFIRQDVTLGPSKTYLLDATLERNEIAEQESVFTVFNDQKYWDSSGFQFPLNATLTSPFGAFRTFNSSYNTRHTGWDFQAAMGTPIMAIAAGKVAFSGPMQIYGNHVIVDHGYGVYSTYSHFSVVHVTQGETIQKGQIIGEVGDTGRTTGPHFHWEVAVNGNFVDGVQFEQMWMP
ncbi:MAG TPA: M23 family metallopeptidase [Phototrophicaceae bacterium]|nr:M23 family metallopeptidase [Phototrophicaceae bacterium]